MLDMDNKTPHSPADPVGDVPKDTDTDVVNANLTPKNSNVTKISLFKRPGFVFFLLNLATFVEYFDVHFIHASLRGIEKSIGLSPHKLASFILVEEFAFIASMPIWGLMSDFFEIRTILMFSLFVSGLSSLFLSMTSNYPLILILRLISGASMSSVFPSTQNYIGKAKTSNSGLAFGIMHMSMSIGRLVSSLIVTTFSTEVICGIDGWRFCLIGFAILSFVASLTMILMPKFYITRPKVESAELNVKQRIKRLFKYIYESIRETFITHTSKILLLVVFFSDGPFVSLGFFIMYFQYAKLSNFEVSIVALMLSLGGIFGGILGGFTADYFHKKSPKYGRLLCAILYLIIRLITYPFMFPEGDDAREYKLSICIATFFNGITYMVVTVIDRPILVDVVLPTYYGSSIGISRCIAGIGSSVIFSVFIGFLIENVFGYIPTKLDVQYIPNHRRIVNMRALKNSVGIVSFSSTAACILLYLAMCFTFGKDMEWTINRRKEIEERSEEEKC